jgi:peptidyl-prolyl cis-trans isomerase-like 4
MSVLIETSLGDITVDLFTSTAPLNANNFLKLCSRKFFAGALFANVQRDFVAEIVHADGRTLTYAQLTH